MFHILLSDLTVDLVRTLVGVLVGLWLWPEPPFGGGFGRAAPRNRRCVVGG